MMSMWHQSEAIELARRIETAVVPMGFHVALGGSVLHQGKSNKDVDIYLYNNKGVEQRPVRDVLAKLEELDIWVHTGQLEAFEMYGTRYVFTCYTGPTRDRRVDVTFLVKLTDELEYKPEFGEAFEKLSHGRKS